MSGKYSGPGEDDWLETQLRQLPQPQPPPDLLPRLLHDADAAPAAQRQITSRWLVAAAVPAAAVLFLLIVRIADTNQAQPQESPARDVSADLIVISTTHSQFKDTDPCHILPPLSDWH